MKDCAGRVLKEGQKVATNINGYTYKLCVCEVIGFTPHKVRIQHTEHVRGREDINFYLKEPQQLCIVND